MREKGRVIVSSKYFHSWVIRTSNSLRFHEGEAGQSLFHFLDDAMDLREITLGL